MVIVTGFRQVCTAVSVTALADLVFKANFSLDLKGVEGGGDSSAVGPLAETVSSKHDQCLFAAVKTQENTSNFWKICVMKKPRTLGQYPKHQCV